jgi:hypothetical protein
MQPCDVAGYAGSRVIFFYFFVLWCDAAIQGCRLHVWAVLPHSIRGVGGLADALVSWRSLSFHVTVI